MYSTQGNITIKRLRNGDNLFLSFVTNGKPLFQSINPETNAIKPDFTIASNQPIITPKADTTMTPNITLLNHSWAYNYETLVWSEEEGDGELKGYYPNEAEGNDKLHHKFAINKHTGAIRIINNIINEESVSNSTLTYSGTAMVLGIKYDVKKSIEVIMQPLGSNPYNGFIFVKGGKDAVLGDEIGTDTITLSTMLYNNGSPITDYNVIWYKDNENWKDEGGANKKSKEVIVTRDDVDGTQLFLGDFVITEGANETVVTNAGIVIADIKDEYGIRFSLGTGAGKSDMVAPEKTVEVTAIVYNAKTNTDVVILNPKWEIDLLDSSSWQSILPEDASGKPQRIQSNTVNITTEHTDYVDETGGSRVRDIVVLAEVEFTGIEKK